eukprot:COSAG01_NODE_43821_length_425_cov_16.122699_1_plen_72_part_10
MADGAWVPGVVFIGHCHDELGALVRPSTVLIIVCVLRGRALRGGWGVALTKSGPWYSQDAALSDFERAEAWL